HAELFGEFLDGDAFTDGDFLVDDRQGRLTAADWLAELTFGLALPLLGTEILLCLWTPGICRRRRCRFGTKRRRRVHRATHESTRTTGSTRAARTAGSPIECAGTARSAGPTGAAAKNRLTASR